MVRSFDQLFEMTAINLCQTKSTN